MSNVSGEDDEIVFNASLENSPEHLDAESSRAFLDKLLVSMSSNAVKSGIDDIAARLKQNGTSSSSSSTPPPKSNGSSMPSDPSTISNHTPTMQLTCVECGVAKSNSEEMEIHIKTEHLNWLPFQCPICLQERASDSQMREHIHSAHQKNMSKFIYVDNVTAKRKLQVLMDKSFSLNVTKRMNGSSIPSSSTATSPYSPPNYRSAQSSGRNTSTSNGSTSSSSATAHAQAAATAIVKHQTEKEKQSAQAAADFLKLLDFTTMNGAAESVVDQKSQSIAMPSTSSASRSSGGGRKRPYVPTSATEAITTMELTATPSNADAFLATLNSLSHAQTPENEENDQPSFSLDDLNIDSSSALATLFGGGSKKVKYEDSEEQADGSEDPLLDGLNPISVLDNVAALFGSTPDRTPETSEITKKSSSISKKRVLGECSKCQKPVTAGARQMHMFFHLAKDEMIFRFRCKHDGCAVEHYRKDQMENHQSKAHGRIDPDMMEDRSLELFQKCQELNHELFVAHRHGGHHHRASPHQWSGGSADMAGYQDLSMELLGTKNGTIPGPTAAKAEIAYAAQQAANAQRNAQKKAGTSSSSSAAPGSSSNVYTGFGPLKLVPDEDHPLQCKICGKTMQNRIRGFHILWHMAKDKGINRYTCKYCNFGHDRSQSVQVHGKKEHGTDDCVEDRIGEYQDDVKEMSAACFGISSLFAQESKRKNKFPAAAPRENKDLSMVSSAGASPLVVMDEEVSNDSSVMAKMEEPELEEEMEEEKKALFMMDEDMTEEIGDVGEEEYAEQEEQGEELDDHDETEYMEEEDRGEDLEDTPSKKKRKSRRTFNARVKKSKKQMREAAMARHVSILIGGAQFCKKKVNEFAYCEKCGKQTNCRLTEHAYTHMDGVDLFECGTCDFATSCKDTILKHIRETHPGCADRFVDNRLKYIREVKSQLAECFPAFYVDHPLPTRADIEKLRGLLAGSDQRIGGIAEYLKAECGGGGVDEEISEAPDEEEEEEDELLPEEDDATVTSE